MTRRIVVMSQKGGVGKTTVCLNLALALAERGRRVLLVDLDPAGGVGHSLARGDAELTGIAEVLTGALQPPQAVLSTKLASLSLLPRGRLDATDVIDFERALVEAGALDRVLASVEGGFDEVVIDTPSGLGMPTRAALQAAHFVLLPVQAEPLAIRSFQQALRVVAHVRAHENPKLELLGILPTMVEKAKEPSLTSLIAVWTDFAGVLETVIPRVDVFAEASAQGVPVGYLGGPVSPEARRFNMLAAEVEQIMDQLSGKGGQDVDRPARALL